jgi:putative flippase GtrA
MLSLDVSTIQVLRFAVVGLASNLSLFMLYLLIVSVGLNPKASVTLVYILSILITFVFNKRWSFSHRGDVSRTILRYVSVYAALYVINVLVLLLFVDLLDISHAFVQAGVVMVFIPVVFLMQRYWVFAKEKPAFTDS